MPLHNDAPLEINTNMIKFTGSHYQNSIKGKYTNCKNGHIKAHIDFQMDYAISTMWHFGILFDILTCGCSFLLYVGPMVSAQSWRARKGANCTRKPPGNTTTPPCDLEFAAYEIVGLKGPRGSTQSWSLSSSQNGVYDSGTKVLYKTCDRHNLKQKAHTEELMMRFLTNCCVDSEFNVKKQPYFQNVHATLDSQLVKIQKVYTSESNMSKRKSLYFWSTNVKIYKVYTPDPNMSNSKNCTLLTSNADSPTSN